MSMPAQELTRWERQIVALNLLTFFSKPHPGCKHVMCFRPSVRVSILKNDRRYTFTGFLLEDDWRRDNCLSGWAGCFLGWAGRFSGGEGSTILTSASSSSASESSRRFSSSESSESGGDENAPSSEEKRLALFNVFDMVTGYSLIWMVDRLPGL